MEDRATISAAEFQARETWARSMEENGGAAKLSCAADIRAGNVDMVVIPAMLAYGEAVRLAEGEACAGIADRVSAECANDVEFVKRDGDGNVGMPFGGKIEAGRVAYLIRARLATHPSTKGAEGHE